MEKVRRKGQDKEEAKMDEDEGRDGGRVGGNGRDKGEEVKMAEMTEMREGGRKRKGKRENWRERREKITFVNKKKKIEN